ncbi:glycosyltransferase family 2 protein [Bacillus sp. FJAT-47783]|uniref:glycosyltransferase family 2 protein n=1 Tax=Bacillus sp. FJAT-47783 TaxID=2922712 RepID=UPI001FABFB38|nr:glycosyltransferase family 2 protein [Bacillus sp. FJAT-47783]
MDYVQLGFTLFQWLLIFFWVYWIVLSMFGFGKPKLLKSSNPKKRFLILVPAHNEEAVIGDLVENLLNLDYPNRLYDVYVIADNCSDDTAKITQTLRVGVIEHTSPPGEPRGKPYAIRYALQKFGDDLVNKYDGVAIFDADNLVASNYLKEMNNHFIKGDKIIQCYLDSKNANDNWVSLSYSTSFVFANRFMQLAKTRLGLSNLIGGTGFCVDTKLLNEIGWNAQSLTEDLEFTIQSIIRGVPVNWCHTTRVFDEKPTSFVASCVQRLRWSRGHWDVTFRYSHKLLKKVFLKGDIKSFDAFLFLINPGKMVLASFTSLLVFVDFVTNQQRLESVIPWQTWIVLILYYFIFISYPLIVDIGQRKIGKIIKSCISLWLLHYSNVPLYFWGLITVKNNSWNPTKHSRKMSLADMVVARRQVAAGREKK